jgi:AAA ATPase domain
MKLKVSNLGVLGSAEIDLSKQITLFFGPNGTGKTYLSYVIYSLVSSSIRFENTLEKVLLDNLIAGQSFDWAFNAEDLASAKTTMLAYLRTNLPDLFALTIEKGNELFGATSFDFVEADSKLFDSFLQEKFSFKLSTPDWSVEIRKKIDSDRFLFSIPIFDERNRVRAKALCSLISSEVLRYIALHSLSTASIFPVERNSVYTFSKELSLRRNEILDKLQSLESNDIEPVDSDFLRQHVSRYPRAIRDGLRVAEDLANISKEKSYLFNLAEEIESDLLGGKVSISNEGQIEFASKKAGKINFSFHQSSSIVKTLASLVIYLKHRAKNNDLVIIDEPELNLHPSAQILLTRALARMANSGLRLLISTHSDYIVREFNNLIMLHSQSHDPELEKIAREAGYTPQDQLDPATMGAYHFDFKSPKSKQAIAKQIPIDQFGIEVSSFDETISKLNKVSDEIYYALKYGKAKA